MTANLPASAARATGYDNHIVKSVGTNNRLAAVDYVEVSGNFAAGR